MSTKPKQIECRLIVGEVEGHKDSTPGLTAAGLDWLDVCDLAHSDDAANRAEFVKIIDRHEPGIVPLAADMVKNGQMTPIIVRKGLKKTFVLVAGRKRLLATLYNACRIAAPVARIMATVGDPGETTTDLF